MKLFHISDLHIGKRVNSMPMLEQQQQILAQILEELAQHRPQGLLISGDVYDKSVPSADAVCVFDEFLYQVYCLQIPVFLIGGNHDSTQRLSFGSRLMEGAGVHIAPAYNGRLEQHTLTDEYGPVDIYLLPFVRPSDVRPHFPEVTVESYQDAVAAALSEVAWEDGRRKVLLAHQFVTGAQLCDSEEFNVGGLDNVASTVLEGFDYVALGHIHGAQWVGQPHIRYCGSPLKYSFSEEHHQKSITLVTLAEPGQVGIDTIPLSPSRDLRTLRGSFQALTDIAFYSAQKTDDYLHIILTDETEVPEAIGRLRSVYPNTMLLDYDNLRTSRNAALQSAQDIASKSQLELFGELYAQQNNQSLTPEQTQYLENLIDEVWRVAP